MGRSHKNNRRRLTARERAHDAKMCKVLSGHSYACDLVTAAIQAAVRAALARKARKR